MGHAARAASRGSSIVVISDGPGMVTFCRSGSMLRSRAKALAIPSPSGAPMGPVIRNVPLPSQAAVFSDGAIPERRCGKCRMKLSADVSPPVISSTPQTRCCAMAALATSVSNFSALPLSSWPRW